MVTSSRVESLDSLSALESAIEPRSVQKFLASQHWVLRQDRQEVAQLWRSPPSHDSGRRVDLFLPLDQTFVDFNRRFSEALNDLAAYYSLPLDQLSERIALIRTDLLLVRLDQDTLDGTIRLGQATALMESLQRMVKAAATTAADPSHSGKGKRPPQVYDFLRENLRFGHTRRGSFILTVAARLPDVDGAGAAVRGNDQAHDEVIEYPRRVMQSLARGLDAARRYVSDDVLVPDVDTAIEAGATLELVQSLLEITEDDDVRGIDLSFEWSETRISSGLPRSLHFSADEVPKIEEFRDRLVRKQEPEEVTLVGRVASLDRDERRGVEQSFIILEAEIGGRLRKVRVELMPEDYEWAIRAHQARLLFVVSGTLVKKRSWELEGMGRADVTQLRRLLDSRPT